MNVSVALRAGCDATLIVVGIVVAGVSIIALVDPVGTKPADDADPFGPPSSRFESTLFLLTGLALVAAAMVVIRSIVRGQRRLTTR